MQQISRQFKVTQLYFKIRKKNIILLGHSTLNNSEYT